MLCNGLAAWNALYFYFKPLHEEQIYPYSHYIDFYCKGIIILYSYLIRMNLTNLRYTALTFKHVTVCHFGWLYLHRFIIITKKVPTYLIYKRLYSWLFPIYLPISPLVSRHPKKLELCLPSPCIRMFLLFSGWWSQNCLKAVFHYSWCWSLCYRCGPWRLCCSYQSRPTWHEGIKYI